MSDKALLKLRLILAAELLLLLSGCLQPTKMLFETQQVGLPDTKTVTAAIDFKSGLLNLSGGAEGLLEADFQYSLEAQRPQIDYQLNTGDTASLVVRQPEALAPLFTSQRNQWDLQINAQVPLYLKLNLGAGLINLNLAGLSLTGVDIFSHQPNSLTLNLTGYWQQNLPISIQGKGGILSLLLPQGSGVRLELGGRVGKISPGTLQRQGQVFWNQAYSPADVALQVSIAGDFDEVRLESGYPGDMPIEAALDMARFAYSTQGMFKCDEVVDDGRQSPGDTVRDLWYDYLCERGPDHRLLDGGDLLTEELAHSMLLDQIRRQYYRGGAPLTEEALRFNISEFLAATVDMHRTLEERQEFNFSITHFIGSFTYSIERIDDRLYFLVDNQTDRASGTHIPLRYETEGYQHSLETLVNQDPALGKAYLLEVIQSNRYPLISLLDAKTRQQTQGEEGGGVFRQTFRWSERYLPYAADLPDWPEYLDELEIE